jgi:hypothetical protein
MSKFSLDYSDLANKIVKRAYRLSDVKDQLETVAFDIVRFKDADKGAELWQVQSADDGDYIVALYDDTSEAELEKTAGKAKECNCGHDKREHKDDGCTKCKHCKKFRPLSDEISEEEMKEWGVKSTKNGSFLQISYKGDPIIKMSSAQLGIPQNELHLAEHYLPEKLATNKSLVKALLKELNDIARSELFKRYPELV